MTIVVVSTVTKKILLYENEFVRPITDIILQAGRECNVVHIKDINEKIIADKIIISGTAYQDNEFLEYTEKIKYLLALEVPILGICAGAELLLPKEIRLENISEIGPLPVKQIQKDTFFSGIKIEQAYFLHQKGIRTLSPLATIEATHVTTKGVAAFRYKKKPLWGMQFHPEVDKKELIRKFIKNDKEEKEHE